MQVIGLGGSERWRERVSEVAAHGRERGKMVVEPRGCVWNSDQWIDYANTDQMYRLTATSIFGWERTN